MNGLQVAAAIRTRRDARALPLVLATSGSRRPEPAGEDPFAAHLTKPIKPSVLLATLRRALGLEPALARSVAPADPAHSDLGARTPLAILVAEDNLVNQKVALRMLQRLGYSADIAFDGSEVLTALASRRYDVVFMDMQMPVLDGIETTRRIRAEWTPEQIPRIVAMTANAMQGDRERCLDAGMDDYVSKPVNLEELRATLERAAAARPPAVATAACAPAATPLAATLRDAMAVAEPGFVSELVEIFLTDTPQRIAALRDALANEDAAAFAHALHAFRGSASTLGATSLAALCFELGRLVPGRDSAPAAACLARLELEFENLRTGLEPLRPARCRT